MVFEGVLNACVYVYEEEILMAVLVAVLFVEAPF